jgi:hypothetical protein
MTVISNKAGSATVVHAIANGTVVVAGNNSVSNIALGTEIITGASISRIWWGTTNNITIARGSNVDVILTQSGFHDYSGHGCLLTVDRTANVIITINGSGHVVLELKKEGQFS